MQAVHVARCAMPLFLRWSDTSQPPDDAPAALSHGAGTAGVSIAEATQAVEQLVGQFAQQPAVLIRKSAVGVIPGVTDQDRVSGAVHDGRIYLFLDQLDSRPTVVRTLWHELLHYGLRRFLTREQYLAQMQALYRGDLWIRRQANRFDLRDVVRQRPLRPPRFARFLRSPERRHTTTPRPQLENRP